MRRAVLAASVLLIAAGALCARGASAPRVYPVASVHWAV